jgi:poly(hydroxyalkanoate) depolymerase family esterase
MTNTLQAGLLEAARLTNAGRLTEATVALQRMLARGRPAVDVVPATATSASGRGPPTLDGVADAVGTAAGQSASPAGPRVAAGAGAGWLSFSPAAGVVRAMPEALRSPLGQVSRGGPQLPGSGLGGLSPAGLRVPVPGGAQFLADTFSMEAGSRPYKLYVPSGYRPGEPVPLIVMLHGCTQSPDDFAAGTRMNAAAEEHTCLVVYPGQTASANIQRCWNWFSKGDQQRGRGEPALIAGITREVMRNYAVDSRRVYIAGLSAGGATAAIMGEAYPDLYAAIGVHSGLACGAASDMPSAFAAMQGGGMNRATRAERSEAQRRVVPAIVFHGDRDTTVNPRNADAVVTQSARAATLEIRAEDGQVPGGYSFSRMLHAAPDGRTVIEQWVVHGAGHAWFGGSPAGSYTDPHGPDATREMLRFFLQHPHPAPAP